MNYSTENAIIVLYILLVYISSWWCLASVILIYSTNLPAQKPTGKTNKKCCQIFVNSPPPHPLPSPHSPLSCLSWIQFFGRFCCSLLVNFASRLNIAMIFLYALCCAVHLSVSLHFSVYFFYKMLLFNHMILWFYYFFSFLLKVKVEE